MKRIIFLVLIPLLTLTPKVAIAQAVWYRYDSNVLAVSGATDGDYVLTPDSAIADTVRGCPSSVGGRLYLACSLVMSNDGLVQILRLGQTVWVNGVSSGAHDLDGRQIVILREGNRIRLILQKENRESEVLSNPMVSSDQGYLIVEGTVSDGIKIFIYYPTSERP